MNATPEMLEMAREVARLKAELARAKKSKDNAQHSAKTCDHGSPPKAVELGRLTLGHFDLDPSSSDYWNHYLIKAKTFYSAKQDGLDTRRPWFGNVWLNPPGPEKDDESTKGRVGKFWDRLFKEWHAANVDAAIWFGFSLEQTQTLQGRAAHPLQFPTLIPNGRLDCLTRAPGNAPPLKQGSPTHGSFITLLPSRRDRGLAKEQLDRFVALGSRLDLCPGAIVRPLVA